MSARAALFVAALGFPGFALGQTPPSEEMKRELDQRDEVIRDLQQRVEALEQQLHKSEPRTASPHPRKSEPDDAGAEEDETARALERALVREGGFLLPQGSFELEPRILYTYRAERGLAIVSSPSGAQVTERDSKQDRLEGALAFRAGLPWRLQAELRVPYAWTREETSAAALGLSQTEQRSGRGDIELQLSRQFLGERGAIPALLGSLTWNTGNGEFEVGRLSAGTGFPSIQAALTAVKRQDPFVFFGSLSYTAYRSREYGGNDIDPGNGVGLRFGAILAASPETSLRAGLDFSRTTDTRLDEASIPGSSAVSAVLELGLSTLLSRRTLLDLSVGVGMTPDAPDLRIGLSLPIRLN